MDRDGSAAVPLHVGDSCLGRKPLRDLRMLQAIYIISKAVFQVASATTSFSCATLSRTSATAPREHPPTALRGYRLESIDRSCSRIRSAVFECHPRAQLSGLRAPSKRIV